jgi:hypothetical protein
MKKKFDEKQEFLDATVQGLYAAGFPLTNIYPHAEKLWAAREKYLLSLPKPAKETK